VRSINPKSSPCPSITLVAAVAKYSCQGERIVKHSPDPPD
jgi:hypothetical protein